MMIKMFQCNECGAKGPGRLLCHVCGSNDLQEIDESVSVKIKRGHYAVKKEWPGINDPDKDHKLSEFMAEKRRLTEQLKHDLFREFGLENYPKKEKIWDKAWEVGHATGFMDVFLEFEDLVDLLVL